MKTSTKVLIGLAAWMVLRNRAATAAALAPAPAAATAAAPWRPSAPTTSEFYGGESGYGTNPLGSFLTRLFGSPVGAPRLLSSASAAKPGYNDPNGPYAPGEYQEGAGGQPGIPGDYTNPLDSHGLTVTFADPSISLSPFMYGDNLIWALSPVAQAQG